MWRTVPPMRPPVSSRFGVSISYHQQRLDLGTEFRVALTRAIEVAGALGRWQIHSIGEDRLGTFELARTHVQHLKRFEHRACSGACSTVRRSGHAWSDTVASVATQIPD